MPFCYVIYLSNTQHIPFLNHKNNQNIYVFFALLVRIFSNATKVPNIHPILLLFKCDISHLSKGA